MGLICSLGPAYILGFLKLYFLNVSLPFFFKKKSSKDFSNLDIREYFWEGEE
jgi:hypothetical protein